MLAAIEKSDMTQEEKDLATHVEICALRYQAIEDKYRAIDKRLTTVEDSISTVKSTTQQGFSDIKILLEKQNSTRQTQLIATFGTIVTAILGFIGYIIVKIH